MFVHCRLRLLICAGALLLFGSSRALASEFLPLGHLPGGEGFVASHGLSVDDGGSTVVGLAGASAGPGAGNFAFIWDDTHGIRPVPGATDATYGNAVSGDGTAVVGDIVAAQSSGSRDFVWTNADGFQFPIDPIDDLKWSFGADVSGNGSVMVGTRTTDAGLDAFRWTATTGFTSLGDLGGSPSPWSTATAISHDGKVIVGASKSPSISNEAYRWTAEDGMFGLGLLPTGTFTTAINVSANGKVVVGEGDSHNRVYSEEAFRWEATTGIVGLGSLPGHDARSFATGASDDGSIIVGLAGYAPDAHAFVWDAQHGMRDLQQLLTDQYGLGSALAGWQLYWAHDISPDGLSIVGDGYNPQGQTEAWLVRLDHPLTAPEPSSFVLAFLAAGIVYLASRKQRLGRQRE